MLIRVSQDPGWLGDTSYVNTTDYKPVNEKQCIHQPPPGVTSSTWYAICAGTRIGIFASPCVQTAHLPFFMQTHPFLGTTSPNTPKVYPILFTTRHGTGCKQTGLFSLLSLLELSGCYHLADVISYCSLFTAFVLTILLNIFSQYILGP